MWRWLTVWHPFDLIISLQQVSVTMRPHCCPTAMPVWSQPHLNLRWLSLEYQDIFYFLHICGVDMDIKICTLYIVTVLVLNWCDIYKVVNEVHGKWSIIVTRQTHSHLYYYYSSHVPWMMVKTKSKNYLLRSSKHPSCHRNSGALEQPQVLIFSCQRCNTTP